MMKGLHDCIKYTTHDGVDGVLFFWYIEKVVPVQTRHAKRLWFFCFLAHACMQGPVKREFR